MSHMRAGSPGRIWWLGLSSWLVLALVAVLTIGEGVAQERSTAAQAAEESPDEAGIAASRAEPGAETSAQRAAFYNQRLSTASSDMQSRVRQLQAEGKRSKWTFDVGYTTALDRSPQSLAATRVPSNLPDLIRSQNARSLALGKALGPKYEITVCSPKPVCNANSSSFSWYSVGKVTPVRDQGNCGSCWDFTTMGAFEAAYAIKNEYWIDTAEQQILSCSGAGTCAGGWWAFNWLLTHSVTNESAMPYTATNGTCTVTSGYYRAVNWGYVNGMTPSVADIKTSLFQHGPLASAVAALRYCAWP